MKASVERLAPRIRKKLSRSNQAFFNTLLELADERGWVNFEDALKTLYPGVEAGKALKSYSKLREAVAAAADKAGLPSFKLVTDGRTRTVPADRHTWFEVGEQSTTDHLKALVRSEAAVTDVVAASGMAVEYQENRRPVRCRVFFAPEDEALKRRLLISIVPFFRSHPRFRVLPAEPDAETAEIGLVLMNFSSSRVLLKEAAPFVAKVGEANVISVAISPMPAIKRGPEVFADSEGRAFSQLKTPVAQERFARELFAKISACLDGLPDSLPDDRDESSLRAAARFAAFDRDFDYKGFVRPDGRLTTQDKNAREDAEEKRGTEFREDALDFLNRWLEDPKAAPYFALLGETGLGKTTLCKAFTLELLDRMEAGEDVPFPLYLDLRNIGEDARRGLQLEEILAMVIERSWKSGPAGPKVKAAELIDLVERQGALVIFDGLDEVLVHLNENSGQLFTRQLYRMAPPVVGNVVETRPRPFRRLLISCRTHYFRTLSEQKTHFLAEGRDSVEKESYRAFLLMPFSEAQIRAYVAVTLPDENVDRVMETLDAVHNLRELAERPFTLSLIVRQFSAIEQDKADGRVVTGLTLYRNMVRDWLQRDTGKHLFSADHKQALMEFFAADLWRSGERFWSVQELERRLVGFVASDPEYKELYAGKGYELLKEDLRTATFLVREGEDRFRFAHTSLQEFFLAGYLRRALMEEKAELWALPAGVSRETLDFLGQWLMETLGRERETAFRSLGKLRDEYLALGSELAFRYCLRALEKGYPVPGMAGFQLPGADLREVVVRGKAGAPLMLAGADFSGANLRGSPWRYCNLEGAEFGGAKAEQAEWVDCFLVKSGWEGAALEGVALRDCGLDGVSFGEGRWPRVLRCRGGARQADKPDKPAAHRLPAIRGGHSARVTGCSYSPDGRRIVSASGDGTLRVWDAESGESVLTFAGHEDTVAGCAYSPDGRRIVSASHDGTLRVWDAVSGESVLTLTGHTGSVMGCGYSPDGSRIVSASNDNTLRVWDVLSGQALLTLAGHTGGVMGCGYSPNGRRIISASNDNTLRVWDAGSGETALTLTGHTDWVRGCGYSPDGRRIVSASYDNTLRVWDAGSGETVLALTGHTGPVTGCGYSPDGRRIVSASYDNTLRVWVAGSGETVLTLTGRTGWVRGCGYSPDGRRIVSTSSDGTLRVWDAVSGGTVLTLTGHTGGAAECAYSPDGRRIVSASSDNTLRVWDAESGEEVLTLAGHTGEVLGCGYSPDGRRIVSASSDKTLRVWDAVNGETVLTLTGHTGGVQGCGYSPDGRRNVSASSDKTLRVWDIVSGETVLTLKGHTNWVMGCGYSPDGARIVSASHDKTLRVWDAESGETLLTLTGHTGEVMGCGYSRDGSRIVSASLDSSLRVWDAVSGKFVLTLTGHTTGVRGCAYSPDGRRIVSASSDKTLRVWDAKSGETLLTLMGHTSTLTACGYSPDGSRILSASDDGSVRIWDAGTGDQIGATMYHLRNRGGNTWASIDERKKDIIGMGSEAWRSVGWVVHDEETGMPEWRPAEAFGPIPIHD